jgi:hypothetical protein
MVLMLVCKSIEQTWPAHTFPCNHPECFGVSNWLFKLCQCCVQVLRHRYERLRGVSGRIQNGLGELATMGERVQSLLSWRDPRYHFILWQCCPCKYVALWVGCI